MITARHSHVQASGVQRSPAGLRTALRISGGEFCRLLCVIIFCLALDVAYGAEEFKLVRLNDAPETTCAAFSADGKTLACATHATEKAPATVQLFDVASHRRTGELTCDGTRLLRCIAFDGTHGTLAAATDEHSFNVWDITRKKLVQDREEDSRRLRHISIAPNGQVAAALTEYGELSIWDPLFETKQSFITFAKYVAGTTLFSPKGTVVYAVCTETIVAWDYKTKRTLGQCYARQTKPGREESEDPFCNADISHDGKYLAVTCGSESILLFDALNLQLLREYVPEHPSRHPIRFVRFMAGSKALLATGANPYCETLAVDTMRRDKIFGPPKTDAKPCHDLAITVDRKTAALVSKGSVYLISLPSEP